MEADLRGNRGWEETRQKAASPEKQVTRNLLSGWEVKQKFKEDVHEVSRHNRQL
jgi:hypothetical protein